MDQQLRIVFFAALPGITLEGIQTAILHFVFTSAMDTEAIYPAMIFFLGGVAWFCTIVSLSGNNFLMSKFFEYHAIIWGE